MITNLKLTIIYIRRLILVTWIRFALIITLGNFKRTGWNVQLNQERLIAIIQCTARAAAKFDVWDNSAVETFLVDHTQVQLLL